MRFEIGNVLYRMGVFWKTRVTVESNCKSLYPKLIVRKPVRAKQASAAAKRTKSATEKGRIYS